MDAWARVPDAVQVRNALEEVSVPSFVLDRDGVIRWANAASIELFGDLRGRPYTAAVPKHVAARARERFGRVVNDGRAADLDAELVASNGDTIHVGVSAVPLRNGEVVVGLFGQLLEAPRPAAAEARPPHLTPREFEVVRLMAEGLPTRVIAERLGLKEPTVKAHVRGALRALGASTRLEAVAIARRDGLLDGVN
jgi:PAS domain S-box-containing protein